MNKNRWLFIIIIRNRFVPTMCVTIAMIFLILTLVWLAANIEMVIFVGTLLCDALSLGDTSDVVFVLIMWPIMHIVGLFLGISAQEHLEIAMIFIVVGLVSAVIVSILYLLDHLIKWLSRQLVGLLVYCFPTDPVK